MYGTIGLNDAGFNKGIAEATGKGEEFRSKITGLIETVGGIKLVSAAFDMIRNSIGGAVERYDILNRFPMMLEKMGYNADDAAAATEKLKQGVLGLPTPLQDIVSTAQGLVTLTGNLETATDTALALNNAFLASGASAFDASRGMIQYQQMLAKGTPDMQSWRTLQETMGYALRQTAEAFGFAGTSAVMDLYGALQSGNITFEQFNAQLITLSNATGGFAEMAKSASVGIGTAWTNMQTAIVRGVAGIITAIDTNLTKNSLPNLQGMIERAGKAFEWFLTQGANLAGSIVSVIAPAVNLLSDNLHILTPLLIGVGSAFAAHQVITAWNAAASKTASIIDAAGKANATLITSLSKSTAAKTAETAATVKAEAAAARETAIVKANEFAKAQAALTSAKIKLAKAEEAQAAALNTAMMKGEEAAYYRNLAAKQTGIAASKSLTIAKKAEQAASNATALSYTLEEKAIVQANTVKALHAQTSAASTAATQADSAAKLANTAAQNANNVSLTLGQSFIAMATGQITVHTFATNLATAATTAFGVAWKVATGPVGIAIGVVGALAAGIAIIVNANKNAANSTERLSARFSALNTEISKTSEMDAQIRRYKELRAELENTSLSTDQIEEKTRYLNGAREWIIENSGGIIAAEDGTTAAFDRQLSSLEKLTAEQLELQGAQLKSAMIDAQLGWAAANDKLNESIEKGNVLSEEQINLANNKESIFTKIEAIMTAQANAETEASAAVARMNDALTEASTVTGLNINSTNTLRTRIDELNASASNAAETEENRASFRKQAAELESIYARAVEEGTAAETARVSGQEEVNRLTAEGIALMGDQFAYMARLSQLTDEYGNFIGDSTHALEIFEEILSEYGVSLAEVEDALTSNTEAQSKAGAEVENFREIIKLAINSGLIPAETAFKKYGISANDATKAVNSQVSATKTLIQTDSTFTPSFMKNSSSRKQATAEEVQALIGYGLTAQGVMEGIIAVRESEDRIQAEIVSRKEARDAALLRQQIQNANDLGLTLDEYTNHLREVEAEEKRIATEQEAAQEERKSLIERYTEFVDLAFDKISTKSRGMAKKVKKTLDDNAAALVAWSENLKTLQESGIFSPEALAEIAAGGAEKMGGFVADLLKMPENKQKEVATSYENAMTAAKTAGETEAKLMTSAKDAATTALVMTEADSKKVQGSYTATVTASKKAAEAQVVTENFSTVAKNSILAITNFIDTSTAVNTSMMTLITNAKKTTEAQVVTENFATVGQNIILAITGFIDASTAVVASMIATITGAKTSAEAQVVTEKFATVGENIILAITGFINASTALATSMATLITGARIAADTTVKGTADGGNIFKPVGESIIQGIIDGLNSKSGNLYGKIREIAEEMKKQLKKSWGIKSPSTVAFGFAEFIGEGFIDGFDYMKGQIADAIDNAFSYAPDPIAPNLASIKARPSTKTMAAESPRADSGSVSITQYIQSVAQTPTDISMLSDLYLRRARWVRA